VSADAPTYFPLHQYRYSRRVWAVYKRSRGGNRWVCDASSERSARLIAKALNAQEQP
jgi:hypothetical protein